MEIEILHLLDGAEKATGTAVVIDVFRAFSLEAYLYQRGAALILPVQTVQEALDLKKEHPEYLLAGERHGVKVQGFDVGNSPSAIMHLDVQGKTVIHTTSAGVQGLLAASHADEVISGALVNAAAIARYLKKKNPDHVSLVCMGLEAKRDTEEDVLCAEYIRSLLQEKPLADIDERIDALRDQEGKKFFDPAQQNVFPQADFGLCTKRDCMNFVIQAQHAQKGIQMVKIDA